MAVPIDILTLNRDSEPEFLQQAADATGGVYMDLGGGRSGKSKTQENGSNAGSEAAHGSANGRVEGNAGGSRIAGLLQTLMMAYLPDQSARHHLVPGGESEAVDFRAACFCHGRVVDLGWVCSICLSSTCPTPSPSFPLPSLPLPPSSLLVSPSLSNIPLSLEAIMLTQEKHSLLPSPNRRHMSNLRHASLPLELRNQTRSGAAEEKGKEETIGEYWRSHCSSSSQWCDVEFGLGGRDA